MSHEDTTIRVSAREAGSIEAERRKANRWGFRWQPDRASQRVAGRPGRALAARSIHHAGPGAQVDRASMQRQAPRSIEPALFESVEAICCNSLHRATLFEPVEAICCTGPRFSSPSRRFAAQGHAFRARRPGRSSLPCESFSWVAR